MLRLINSFNGCAERISHTAFGEDELRLGWVSLDLTTQSQHLNVNGAVVDLIVVHTAGFEQLLPSQDPLWSGKQRSEQIEFPVGQLEPLSGVFRQSPRAQVQLEFGKAVGA